MPIRRAAFNFGSLSFIVYLPYDTSYIKKENISNCIDHKTTSFFIKAGYTRKNHEWLLIELGFL